MNTTGRPILIAGIAAAAATILVRQLSRLRKKRGLPERELQGQLEAQVDRLRAAVEADPLGYLTATEDLTEADFALMGKVIQLYCFADLSARRIIDVLRHVESGPDARNASRLQDSQVFPKLRQAAQDLPPGNLKDGLIKAAVTVEMHRVHRHNFAHWAARRMRGVDALILYSKNAKEAERRDGIAQAPDELKYAIVPLRGIERELPKLAGHTDYLAHEAARLENNLEVVRGAFE